MLGWILFGIGIIGFGLASYLDLKSTEFPDWLPYSIIILALIIRGIFAFVYNNFSILIESVLIGSGFLLFGLILYWLKQWGDGDAWLLGALGFLFPNSTGFQFVYYEVPFPLILLFNFFLIALFYLIIYSLFLGFKTPKIYKLFLHELKKDMKNLLLIIVIFSLTCLFLLFYLNYYFSVPIYQLTNILLFPPLLIAILLFFRYGRVIEKNFFRKLVSVKNLKIGDVLIKGKWRGLTKEEVKKLKRKGGKVWIKEGVRFAPVFLITLIVSLFYGSLAVFFI